MAIRDLQLNLVQLGRIRLGQKTDGGTGRPERLDSYRFTSPAEHLIREISNIYGGEMRPWSGGVGKQWEVVTDVSLINIYLPPQTEVDPFYETWRGGVCSRRCDGLRDIIKNEPCACNPEARDCKVTTHLSVMLADVPGIGVWRMTTHGIWAASELSQLSALIAGIKVPLPGRLLLENRQRKAWDQKQGKVVQKDFNVPIVLLDMVTARHVQLGADAVSQVLRIGAQAQAAELAATPAIEAAPAAPALEAAPQQPQATTAIDRAMVDRALAAIKAAAPEQMFDIRGRIGKMGDPQEVLDAFKTRLGEHAMAQGPADPAQDPWAQDTPATPPAAPPEPEQPPAPLEAPPSMPTPVESPPSGDRQAAMTRLLGVAGVRQLNRKQLDDRMQGAHGVGLKEATAQQLDALAAAL